MFEGGTRVPGFIHSPLLKKSGYISHALTHVTDWFPTLLRVAGASQKEVSELDLDGIDQYDTFFSNETALYDGYVRNCNDTSYVDLGTFKCRYLLYKS